ncbi:MAG: hypothetical protein IJ001_03780 [Oscillospiraceae bacterium]|nr:hypothetical protein [Oscillospiraceae bacterium]
MALPFVMMMALAVFAVQLVLCFKARGLWAKLLPLLAVAAADLLCWVVYFGGFWADVYGAAFAAFIYGVVLAMILALDGLAWGIWGVVKLVQKRRK